MSNPFAWKDKHNEKYKHADWILKPSVFATEVLPLLPKQGRMLELGAGQGQDSRYFAEHGYDVVSTDLEATALEIARSRIPSSLAARIEIQTLDLAQPFPYQDNSFDIVYAHRALHYFSSAITKQIFSEIYRVLKAGGTLAFLVNSTSDVEYNTGLQLEPDFFEIESLTKRYFTTKSAADYAADFVPTLLDNNGRTHKDRGNHNLIRFIGTKPSA